MAGIWSALDPATGEILWQTANPSGGKAGGAVSVANGVVYACSLDPMGYLYAMDATDGSILWSYASGGSCNSGAAISNGAVFWGSGYASGFDPVNTAADYFRAFAVPKK
jgi:polyvinyl alcohol dehydrogenase (cytochrome)